MGDDEGGGFDARYDRSMKEKMDEWKRGYYKVCHLLFPQTMCTDGCSTCRKNSRYLMMTHRIWAILRSGMYMDCSE